MDDFEKLLDQFKWLPPTQRNLTFMDVAGYAHYENVCSNILAFFIDPNEEHAMGDLLIRSMLSLCDESMDQSVEGVTVAREYPTPKGGRLDLVLAGEGFVLGIENKIFHSINNDLEDYSMAIHQFPGESETRLKVVLGLRPVSQEIIGGFKSITYEQLWQSVECRLGGYVSKAESKWLHYFIDFIKTTRNLTGNVMKEVLPSDQFFIENHDLIEKLVGEREKFLGRLNTKVNQLHGMMLDDEEVRRCLVRDPWIYTRSCLVLDFRLTEYGHSVAIDLYLTPNGWELQLFGRNGTSMRFLKEAIRNSSSLQEFQHCEISTKGRHIIRRWELNAAISEIKEFLVSLVRKVHQIDV
jgi:hypothetical protein